MGARVNIYEEEINQLVRDRGQVCDWERAAVCHCVTYDSGQPNFVCKTCGGSGYRYLAPKRIKVAVSSLNSQVEQESLELREPGTAYITPTDDVIMGYKDRLKFPDFRCLFSEVIHWTEENPRGISPKTYRNITEVVFLADDQYEYESGVDFEITEDSHHIRWLNKDIINNLTGKNMSILYYTTPSYLVIDLLHELRGTLSDRNSAGETFRELPKQYRIKREDFIYNISEPKAIIEDIPTTPEEPEEENKPTEDPYVDIPSTEPEFDTGDGIII